MIRYRVVLSNQRAGVRAFEIDSFTSTDLAMAAEELACLLCSGHWALADGATIRVVEIETAEVV